MSRTKHHRNMKYNFHVDSDFKKWTKRKRRAQEKQAVKTENFDKIPAFKKSDAYDFW